MREHVIIDAYNVLFRSQRFRATAQSNLEEGREALIRWIETRFADRRERVTLVFDGARQPGGDPPRTRSGVTVVYTTPPEDADRHIQRLVDAERRKAHGVKRLPVRVVTSDNEVAERARLWGARAVSVAAFLAEVDRAGPRESGPAPGSSTKPLGGRRRGAGHDRPDDPVDPGASARPAAGKREIDELERLFRDPPDDDEI